MFRNAYHTEDLSKYSFLVTGGAGFIGSNIVEYLLKYKAKKVRVLDNLANGYYQNIKEFENHTAFEFLEGDIRDLATCKKAMLEIDYVSHQAALGSVPRSIDNPILSNEVNVSGFLNMLVAQNESESVKRMVYAASSSTYGDHKALPKVEETIGNPLSPYAVSKLVNELYAQVFYKTYGTPIIGLRYFNVFGPYQRNNGPYPTVISGWIKSAIKKQTLKVFGDGKQTRDFCYVEDVVYANIASAINKNITNKTINISGGKSISLNDLTKVFKKIYKKNKLKVISKCTE